MLERVYDTLIAILYYELPKDNYGKVVSYDRPITAWYIGQRDIKNNNVYLIYMKFYLLFVYCMLHNVNTHYQ